MQGRGRILKICRKTIAWILTLAICIPFCCGLFRAKTAEAAATYSDDGNWRYTVQPDGTIVINEYCGSESKLSIPNMIDQKSVIGIGSSAFYQSESLTGVSIPYGVKEIGSYVFYGCTNLTSVSMPESLTGIGYAAFQECSSLANVTIPGSVKTIEDSAFAYCNSLTYMILPNGIESVSASLFKQCTSLNSVVIPDNVTGIGPYAFSDCSGLTSIMLPNGVTTLGQGAFSGCSKLTSIVLPNGVDDIAAYLFSDCISLTGITLPAGVTDIGKSAFSECTGLKSLNIPDSVISIGQMAFSGCIGLTSLTVPASVVGIGGNAFPDHHSFQIVTPLGSYAESYAKSNGIAVQTTSVPTPVPSVIPSSMPLPSAIPSSSAMPLPSATPSLSTTPLPGSVPTQTPAATVAPSKVAEIKILGEVALTGNGGKETYIYYDVLDQYGKSVRTKENVEWTTSPALQGNDKQAGKLTLYSENGFNYGSYVHIVGVHAQSGTVYSNAVMVGSGQAANTIKFAGFLARSGGSGILQKIPADFAANTYVVLYKIFDQNGNVLDLSGNINEKLTFLSYAPQLLPNPLADSTGYTVNSEVYAGAQINPGPNIKQGGDVRIMVLSNTTGAQTILNFNISSSGGIVLANSITPTPSPAVTPTLKPTPSPAATPTLKPTPTPTVTPTVSPSATPMVTLSPTVAPTLNPTSVPALSPTPEPAKKSQTVQAKSITAVYGRKPFYLSASAPGGKLSYSVANKKVVVISSYGKVTVKGYGKTKVTVKAAATAYYKKASKTITIKVIPKKVIPKKIKSPKRGRIIFSWEKNKTVTGYKVWIGTKRNFSTKQVLTLNKGRGSVKIGKVKSGKKYYVRIRSYKEIGEKKYYSKWSKILDVKVK